MDAYVFVSVLYNNISFASQYWAYRHGWIGNRVTLKGKDDQIVKIETGHNKHMVTMSVNKVHYKKEEIFNAQELWLYSLPE